MGGCRAGSLREDAGRRELSTGEFAGDPLTAPTSAVRPATETRGPAIDRDAIITVPPVGEGALLTKSQANARASGPTLGAVDAAMAEHLRDLASQVQARPGVPMENAGLPADAEASATEAKSGADVRSHRDVIEAKVGEVNGRAIRLSELIETLRLGPRLQQTAIEYQRDGKSRRSWMEDSRTLVKDQISAILDDELLVEEGRSRLTAPQKQGLIAFAEETQKNITRFGGGSSETAKRDLAQQGLTEQKVVDEEKKKALIEFQLQEVAKRVRVSKRDERLYYDRHYAEYNPPTTATFRIIRVPVSDAAAVERVREGLASGVAFAELAKGKDNTFFPERGGLTREGISFEGELSAAELFRAKDRFGPLNDPARVLTPGQWAGPIDLPEVRDGRGRVREEHEMAWVYLDTLSQVRRPFNDRDVQLEIFDRLTNQQRERDLKAYFARLKKRASFTSLDEMADRIVEIVAERYWAIGSS
jgi:hypothetical protein